MEHAEEEQIIFRTLCNPVEILDDGAGKVGGIRCVEMELGEPDESGRRRPVEKKGSEFEIEVEDDAIEKVKTVADMVKYIEEKM